MATTAKVHVSWPAATDASGIDSYQLQKKKGTGAWATVTLSSPTATLADVTVTTGTKYQFRLRATDTSAKHNTSAWVTTTASKLALVQENATTFRYSGTWKSTALAGSSGGYVKYAAKSGASATLTFAGTSIGFVTDTGPARGMVQVWLDGTNVATLDLYSATAGKKRIVWSPATSLNAGTHTLELKVLDTKNAHATSTRVDLDALAGWG